MEFESDSALHLLKVTDQDGVGGANINFSASRMWTPFGAKVNSHSLWHIHSESSGAILYM